MRAEWMVKDNDPWDEIKCDKAQKKLLEYLRDTALITPEAYRSPKSIIIKMLKQLEEQNV